MAVPGPYPGAFGMLPHGAGMNGDLAGAAAYAAGLHNMSPQMSAAAAAAAVAAYGRSPLVRAPPPPGVSPANPLIWSNFWARTLNTLSLYTESIDPGRCLRLA